ncbi:ATP synthase F1 subunit delta [Lacticaseibacillus mingshuiensis]|uniref:ATP synthase subunit delta n=1 Tax=Lacticaseibacillus mingshuiensis TaxID=2799574 RepID=A0ABW4CKP7_9LACO|nr:ATP synthase F1 subunit delta [Lacticaseibacillus mingshuiensis]
MALTDRAVAPRYAKALFEAAEDQQLQSQVHDELQALLGVVEQEAGLMQLLTSQTVPQQAKTELVAAMSDGASDLVKNLLTILAGNGRIGGLKDVIDDYERRYEATNGILSATATTAVALTDDQAAALRQAIAKKFDVQRVTLTQKVDAHIVGGVKVETGTAIIDGTVATRLKKLHTLLTAK